MVPDRRRFLTLGALAGCSSQAPTNEAEDVASTDTETATPASD